MRIRNIQIISTDTEYINKILGRLISDIREDVNIEVVTDKKFYESFSQKPHPVDVLFIDENLSAAFLQTTTARNIYVISEKHDANAVSKFDGAAGILRILGDDVLKSVNHSKGHECTVVNVVSPCGGCGKTTASIGIACRLSQMNRKVLYIDAEYVQNFYEVMPDSCKKEVYSDEQLAAAMINMTTNSFELVCNNLVHGLVDYVPPFGKHLASYHLTPAKLVELAEIFANKNLYDYVIVEHGTGLTREEIDSIFKGQRLVIIANKDETHKRVDSFLKLIQGYEGQGTIVLHNCDSKSSNSGSNISIAETVYYDPDQRLDDILANGGYKKAAEAIL